jgi:hypothetical protein
LREAITNVAKLPHQLIQLPHSLSVTMAVEGFEAPTGESPSKFLMPEVKWYGKAYGSIPPYENVKWETGVKASWYIC